MIRSIRRLFVPIHKEGYPFIADRAVVALDPRPATSGSRSAGSSLILTAVGLLLLPRSRRVTPVRDGLVVSPADGRVSMITTAVPPPELGLPPEPMTRISVFMNVFDCHVNRVAGDRAHRARSLYTPGLFLNAELDKASEDNERNGLVIETGGGARSASCRSPAWWRGASSASSARATRSERASASA